MALQRLRAQTDQVACVVSKAALKGNQRVCEWLLSPEVGLGGAHLQADGDGNAPSRLARAEGFVDLAAWLEAAEAEAAEAEAAEAAHVLPDAPAPDVELQLQ